MFRTGWVRVSAVFLTCAAAAVAPLGAAFAQTAPVYQEVATLSKDVVPIEREFTIPQAAGGQYQITFTDQGVQQTPTGAQPAPLAAAYVIITQGATVVTSLNATGTTDGTTMPAPVTKKFDALAGEKYVAHVVGRLGSANGSGPFSLRIASVPANTAVVDVSASLSPPFKLDERVALVQEQITVANAGTYGIALTDLGFPRALDRVDLFLVPPPSSGAAPVVLSVTGATPTASASPTLAAGTYQLIVAGARPDSSDAGAYSVNISTAEGATLFGRTVPVGRLTRFPDVALTAGSNLLRLTDLQFPVALSSGTVLVAHGGMLDASVTTTTLEKTFNVATAGQYQVLAYATPDSAEGTGTYQVTLGPSGGAAALSSIVTAGAASGNPAAFTFTANVTTAGAYRAKLGDFQFPVALSSARLAVVQNGVVTKTPLTATGPSLTLDVPSLSAGPVTILAAVRAATGASLAQSSGTFGVELATTAGTQVALDQNPTQGVGGLTSVRRVTLPQSRRYDITISDLGVPGVFSDLMAVVSQGAQRLGTLVVGSGGGGSNTAGGTATLSDFNATAGNYYVTFLAQPSAPENAATYAIAVGESPPAPTITLTANPTAVQSGGSASLTWSTQNAASCTASSNPAGVWSGTKNTSGTESVAGLTAATTFTLRCTSSTQRTAEQSASVTIQAASSGGGGGGAFSWPEIIALAATLLMTLRRRRYTAAI